MNLEPTLLEILTKNLNIPQREAVFHTDGPLLILAGAGSGKTRVLTSRIANLIAQRKAAPDEVLAVTFTNKAAREMEQRIFKNLLDLEISSKGMSLREPLWVSTFHSFCNRLLRENISLLDYKPSFAIYDDGDQLAQIKKVMKALNICEKTNPAKSFRNRINNAKMLGLSPEQSSKLFFDDKTLPVYRMYEEEMKKANSLDFGDLLLKTYELFRMYPDFLEMYQNKFKYILVDEYQDTNHIQYLLVKLLASKHRNLCVVGDEDQSIYSWRGADISNILNFEKDFPETIVIKLEENYRSTSNIVNAATAVIKNNTERKDKTLFTSNLAGNLIRIHEEKTEYDEARFVIKQIQNLVSTGESSPSDCAIFYRTNAQSRVLEEQLRTNGIPYKIIGGVRFYERMEVKDILSYMKLIANPSDDIAFKRVINTPTRGLGKTSIEKLEELSIQKKLPLLKTAGLACEERIFNAGTTSKIRNFILLMEELQTLSRSYNLVEFYSIILEKTEYVNRLKSENSKESDSRVQNLEELSNALTQFMKERAEASLQSFLEEMALVSDVDSLDEERESVTLMTLHISKGLEFPNVFIVGLEENLFPRVKAYDEDEEQELEEERRLMYVGMTRARQRLFLNYAKSRKVWGQDQYNLPSRFIEEIPKNFIELTSSCQLPKFVSQQKISLQKERTFFESQDFPDYDQSDSNETLKQGMVVRHPTFGAGSIFQIEGTGEHQKISVLFADKTIKKFVAKYARLERI